MDGGVLLTEPNFRCKIQKTINFRDVLCNLLKNKLHHLLLVGVTTTCTIHLKQRLVRVLTKTNAKLEQVFELDTKQQKESHHCLRDFLNFYFKSQSNPMSCGCVQNQKLPYMSLLCCMHLNYNCNEDKSCSELGFRILIGD